MSLTIASPSPVPPSFAITRMLNTVELIPHTAQIVLRNGRSRASITVTTFPECAQRTPVYIVWIYFLAYASVGRAS